MYSEVEGKLDVGFEDRGELQLKNISEPVRAYAVRAGAHSAPIRVAPSRGQRGTNRKRRRALVQAADAWRARDPRAAHLARDRRPLDRVPFRLLARFSRLAQRMRLKFTTTVPWRQPTRHLGGSLVRQVDSQLVAPRQHMSLARSPTWTPACFAARLPLVRHAHLGNS
jgi:hypothetical protein